MSAPVRTDLRRPGAFGDRYRPMRRIGAGGMGTVWEARDEVLGRPVAVKLLSPGLCEDEAAASRFRREAQAAGRLTHPNIAQVFDYGEDDDQPFIVLELVHGCTLRRLLERRGSFPPDQAAAIGAQIADALAAAHAEGIVHRDVKPGNVMVARDGRVKVMDFGIADAAWFEPVTDTGTILATAKYLSPEQATGGSVTPASDVYSLGVVLFEMLAGRPPFDGDSPFAIAYAHAHEQPPPLSELAPRTPADLRGVVEQAMARGAAARPDAAEMAAMLRDPSGVDRTRALPLGAVPTAVVPSAPVPAAAVPSAAARGGGAVRAAAPARSPAPARRVAWALAALLALTLLSALAFAVFVTHGDRVRPDARHPRAATSSVASVAPSPAPRAPRESGGGRGSRGEHGHGSDSDPNGKALGHDEGD
jgi:eukaryotic-like serine/threonine-protein kinase